MSDGTGTARSGVADGSHVFLSYSRDDQKLARTMIGLLEGLGYNVWWDGLIPGGERFDKVTGNALETARAVVVLWSKTSVDSHWVNDEAGRARDRGRLVPISLDGTHPPLGFGQFQFIDISKEGMRADGPQMQRALAALAALFDGDAPALPPVRARKGVNRRAALIAGGAVVAAGAGYAAFSWLREGDGPSNSLAVLPFDNLSGDPAQQYLSDGVAAELRARFARNPALIVAGQISSSGFKGKGESPESIASKLGVASLLSGNVRVAGNEVRVGVELVEAATGFSRWSQSYQRPLDNILKLQEEIAEAVNAALTPRLAAGNSKEPVKRSGTTGNAAAYDAYLHGKELFESQIDEASDRGALARFEEAIRIDPDFAAARAARSRALAVIANQYVQADERKRLFAEAAAEARRAVALASEYPEGHAALAYALLYGQLDFAAAQEPYERTLQFGSGNAGVLSRYALYHARRRNMDKALPAIEKAIRLDPLDPSVFKTKGQVHIALGQWDDAIAASRKALEINPKRSTLHGNIGDALLAQGKLDEAAAEYAAESFVPTSLPGKAAIAMRKGDRPAAEKALADLIAQTGDNSLYQQGQVLAQWGRTADAIRTLEAAWDMRDPGLLLAYTDPMLKPLENEAGFKSLLGKLHFV
ncbi:MAG: TIR domain-containing protein [Novosphingobium sp.]